MSLFTREHGTGDKLYTSLCRVNDRSPVTWAEDIATTLEVSDMNDLQTVLGHAVQPEAFNTIFLATGGNDDRDGKTFASAVETLEKALELAKAITPATDHRTIFTLEARNFEDLVNNLTEGNVVNLVVDARAAVFENVDLTHKTNMLCRRVTGNVLMGHGSQLQVWGSLGTSSTTTVGFVSGAHTTTLLKLREMGANVTLSFSGMDSGSRVRVEIDHYSVDDFDASMRTILDTIPDGVDVSGWIGSYSFGAPAEGIVDFDHLSGDVQDLLLDRHPESRLVAVTGFGGKNFEIFDFADYRKNNHASPRSIVPRQLPNANDEVRGFAIHPLTGVAYITQLGPTADRATNGLLLLDMETGAVTQIGQFNAAALNDPTLANFEIGGITIDEGGSAWVTGFSHVVESPSVTKLYFSIHPIDLDQGSIGAKIHQVEGTSVAEAYTGIQIIGNHFWVITETNLYKIAKVGGNARTRMNSGSFDVVTDTGERSTHIAGLAYDAAHSELITLGNDDRVRFWDDQRELFVRFSDEDEAPIIDPLSTGLAFEARIRSLGWMIWTPPCTLSPAVHSRKTSLHLAVQGGRRPRGSTSLHTIDKTIVVQKLASPTVCSSRLRKHAGWHSIRAPVDGTTTS